MQLFEFEVKRLDGTSGPNILVYSKTQEHAQDEIILAFGLYIMRLLYVYGKKTDFVFIQR